MASQINQILKGYTLRWNEHEFEMSADLISMLHHWNFGTSSSYYRNKNKNIVLPDVSQKLVKIEDVEGALDAALQRYNEILEKLVHEKADE